MKITFTFKEFMGLENRFKGLPLQSILIDFGFLGFPLF